MNEYQKAELQMLQDYSDYLQYLDWEQAEENEQLMNQQIGSF